MLRQSQIMLFLIVFLCLNLSCEAQEKGALRAYLIETQERMGKIVGQKIISDQTRKLLKQDNLVVSIPEIKNPEDINDRQELYVVFDARRVHKLTGYYILKLSVASQEPKAGWVTLDQVGLDQYEKKWVISLRLTGRGVLHSELLYSRTPQLQKEPVFSNTAFFKKLLWADYFQAYPLEGSGSEWVLTKEWQQLNLTIDLVSLSQGEAVDRCQVLLAEFSRQFGTAEAPFLWAQKQVTKAGLEEIIQKISQTKKYTYSLRVETARGEEFAIGSPNFVPQLQQRIVFQDDLQVREAMLLLAVAKKEK